jgi:hypothetical protein
MRPYFLQYSDSSQTIPTFVIVIIVFVILFLIGREIFCWYCKINERISLQNNTNELLQQILSKMISNDEVQRNENSKYKIKESIIENRYNKEYLQNIINKYEQYSKSDVLSSLYYLRERGEALSPHIIEKISTFFDFESTNELWIEINDRSKN